MMIDTLELTDIPAEDEAFHAEIRDFLKEAVGHLDADVRARSGMGFDPEFRRRF